MNWKDVNYRELSGCGDVGAGIRLGDDKQRGELADGHEDEGGEDEEAEAVADDAEVPPDAEVFDQDGGDVGLRFEDLSEFVEAEKMEVAGEAEEEADEEADGDSVEPRAEEEDADDGFA